MQKPSSIQSKTPICGVYRIFCMTSKKQYIGSSIHIGDRFNGHLYDLRAGRHHSVHLQRAWDKYGENDFIFDILEICLEELCTDREQYYLDTLLFASCDDRRFYESGYNICRVAGSNRGCKWSEESKQKLSLQLKKDCKWRGEAHPLAQKTESFVRDILMTCLQTNLSYREIADQFNIDGQEVRRLLYGERWHHIKLLDEYWNNKLEELRKNIRAKRDAGYLGKGQDHHNVSLDERAVMEIRRLSRVGMTDTEIGKRLNIQRRNVNRIRRHETWKHIGVIDQLIYDFIHSPYFKSKAEKGIDVEFGVSTVYLIERLIISHVRVWHLEDKIRLTNSDEERSEIKRQIDYINSKIRPRLICAIEDSLVKAYAENDMTIIGDGNLKHYGKEFEEEVSIKKYGNS